MFAEKLYLLLLFFFAFPFYAHSQCQETEVTVTSTTGDWGYEMSWELYNESGQLIAQFQGVNDNEVLSSLLCIPNGCYTFSAMDSYGDGWNGGSVNLSWSGGTANFELLDGELDLFYFGINASGCVPIIPGCTNPSAYNYDINATVDDGSCLTLSGLIDQQLFDTLCYGGPKDNRINFVIQNRGVGNGNGNFNSADELRAALEETFLPAFQYGDSKAKMPYAQYKNFFNLYAAYWPDAPTDQTWWSFDIIKDMRDELFLPWANEETGWVTWFSTTKFGGGGGAGLDREARVGDGKMYGTDFETLLHEFGHTMPGLLDEYTSSGEWSGNQCFETPNTTQYLVKDSIPWRRWIEEDVPLPTPYDGNYEQVIGAFEGGLTNYFGCHRPTAKGCYMGAGGFGEGYGEDLCSPCIQRVICFLYKYVNVIENPQPANAELSVNGAETLTFSAEVVAPAPNTQHYQWFLNGKLIAEHTTEVDVTFGACDVYELKFTVTDTTELVRYDEKFDETYPKPYREFVWTIDQQAVNSYDLTASASSQNADCTGEQNGSVEFTVQGGQTPYEFWLNGQAVNNPVSALAPGNQAFIVVDANGCAVQQTVTVAQDPLLDLEICSALDGTWEVTVQSDNYNINQLDLLWSTGATGTTVTGLLDGEYSLTAMSDGCTVTENFSLVSAPEKLEVDEQAYPAEMGEATGVIHLEVTGGTPAYQVRWYDRLMKDLTNTDLDHISASGTTWDHLPEMAFDDDLATKWLHAVPTNAWVGYEFPAPTTIAYYAITSADDVPARDPEDWLFQGSNDGTNWVTLDQRSGEDFPNRFQRRAFPISTPTAFSHYRLFVQSSAGENQIQLQELEFIGTDPGEPFFYNPEMDDRLSRTELAPGEYRYEVTDASAGCAQAVVPISVYARFTALGLKVIQESDCSVAIEAPDPAYDYYWLSDEMGSQVFAVGNTFQPPYAGNFYVAAAPTGTTEWSHNRKGFAVTMPAAPAVAALSDTAIGVVDPEAGFEYRWYTTEACGTPVHIGPVLTPGSEATTYYLAAISTAEYPEPMDPATLPGLILRMDAADLDGDGLIDDPAPATSSTLEWYFPTGNNWALDNWFAYRSNYQNGLGIADWATLWLQRIENSVSNYQTVLMAYQENPLSWEGTAPMEGLSTVIPRHSDASQLYSSEAPASTLNGQTYLNGQLVDPLTTENPMEFCILGTVFTSPSSAAIFYTDVHWEGKIGEMLFFDQALTVEQMQGASEYLRQKWISTADLESPRTAYEWEGTVATQDPARKKLQVFPNPTTGLVHFSQPLPEGAMVRVLDMRGLVVLEQANTSRSRSLDLSALPAGLYLLEVREAGEVLVWVKVVRG